MENKKYYYWLDTFRFLSAFLVMLTHSRFWFFQAYGNLEGSSQNLFTKILFFLTSLGGDAVVAFFILSGFLVGGRTIEKLSNGEYVSPTDFALSRIVRIIVPLAAVLLLNTIFNVIQGVPNDYWRILGNLICLQGVFVNPEPGIGVLWTMSYIVWFYVLIWACVLLSQKGHSSIIGGGATLIVLLWVFGHMGEKLFHVTTVGCGVFSYFLAKKRINRSVFFLSIFVAIVATLFSHLSGESMSFQKLPIDRLFIQALQVVSYAVVIGLSVKYAPKKLWAIKFEKWMSGLAKFSYSLYLVHLPIIMMMVYMGVERLPYVNLWSLFLYMVGIALCVVSAWLIYVLIENPSNRLKSFIVNRGKKRNGTKDEEVKCCCADL